MASRHVALVRGINVGKAKRVAMGDLRAVVEGVGGREVRTLLNSGNVVFAMGRAGAGNLAGRIEKGLVAKTGVSARVIVLSAAELGTIVAENPLVGVMDDPTRMLVAVLRDPADRVKLGPIVKKDWGAEKLAVGSRAAYIWCGDGILASQLFEPVSKTLGDGVTTRNWATVLKLQALVGEAG